MVLFLIAVFLALLQYSWLSRWPMVPDLPLALAAWAMVDGTEDGVLIRAWLIGLGVDAIDPGSDCFHAIGFLLLALAYLPLRSLVFRTRFTGWAVWAAICSLVLALVDGWLSGYGDATGRSLVISAGLTALATMGVGWVFSGIPGAYQPVGRGGA